MPLRFSGLHSSSKEPLPGFTCNRPGTEQDIWEATGDFQRWQLAWLSPNHNDDPLPCGNSNWAQIWGNASTALGKHGPRPDWEFPLPAHGGPPQGRASTRHFRTQDLRRPALKSSLSKIASKAATQEKKERKTCKNKGTQDTTLCR